MRYKVEYGDNYKILSIINIAVCAIMCAAGLLSEITKQNLIIAITLLVAVSCCFLHFCLPLVKVEEKYIKYRKFLFLYRPYKIANIELVRYRKKEVYGRFSDYVEEKFIIYGRKKKKLFTVDVS